MRAPAGLRLVVACAIRLLVAASPAAADDPLPASTHIYRVVGGDTLRAYRFLPPGHRAGERAPGILLFHGGGWSAGSAEWTFPTARRFADSGFVAIAIEYRLSNQEITPIDALDDACAAFRWARRQATALGLSKRIAGYGVSAGGQLVAATATVGCHDAGPDSTASRPDALLLWSPALDLAGDQWFASRLKGRATAADLSPARHVRSSTPPTSIVHGERDALTPLAGPRAYCERLRALGRRCDLHVYPGVGHLLTRNLANQESDFDPDPKARADGILQLHRFLRSLGWVRAH